MSAQLCFPAPIARRAATTCPASALARVAVLLMAGAAGLAAGARADDTVPYEVRPGESLYLIAERQLEDPRQWPAIARLNKLPRPSRLQPGQVLRIPAHLLKGEMRPARVEYVRGDVRAGDMPLAIGQALPEGATLQVGAQGFVSLRLHDGSLVQLQSATRAQLVRLRDLPVARRSSTLIQLDQGRADASVAPQAPGSLFRVKTPQATTGVRGTRFGVAAQPGRGITSADVVEGAVEVQATGSAAAQAHTLPAGQGAVLRPGRAALVRPLLPAPALGALPERIERLPHMPDLPPAESVLHLALADDAGFARIVWSNEGSPAAPITGLPDGRYHLRARAGDADGLRGAEATGSLWIKTQPVAPLARAPGEGAAVTAPAVQLLCTEVAGATGYRLQISRDERFAERVLERDVAGACRFGAADLPLGPLYWRVASLAPEPDGRIERGPFGDPSRLIVVPVPLPPSDDVEVDGRRVRWKATPGERYRVQVAADAGFTQMLDERVVEQGAYVVDLPARCTPYALRLQTLDPHGHASAFSPVRLIGSGAGVCTADGWPLTSGSGEPVQRADR